MFIYNYDSITHEFLGSEEAYADPAETEAQGQFVPMIPAFATPVKPPKKGANYTFIFHQETQSWEKIGDYRGKTAVKKDMTTRKISELGNLEDDECILKETQEEKFYEDFEFYIWKKTGLEENPNYDEIVKKREKDKKIQEIKNELDQLDLKSIRAIRANDEEYLKKYEEEAQELRKKLKDLQ